MKAAWKGVALVSLLLLAVVAARTVAFGSRQLEVAAAPPIPVEAASVARRLAQGLRFRTISHQDPSQLPADAFQALARELRAAFPRVHRELALEVVAGHSLLFHWKGSDTSLAPGLLAAHHDVVPVEPGTEESWEQPPFGGVVAEGFVWGRGAMDDKASVYCILEAVEALLAEGFRPARSFYLAFGHDEEVGGYTGALVMAELLQARGVKLEFVLDEGGLIADGVVPGIEQPIALIGIAEKGSVSIGLSVERPGGHSSTPPPHTAVGILASAVHALERNPMPASLDGPTRTFLEYLGPELPLPFRVALANLWLTGPLVKRAFSGDRAMNAMVRTTTAATIFSGGVKENVLPAHARAVVNFRIRPGETSEDVARHVRRTIDDERIQLQVGLRTPPREPSPVSPVEGAPWERLERTIRESFPEASVVPYLVVGGTDARHYAILTECVYRFGPFVYGGEDITRAHGSNERISVANLAAGVAFYVRLLRNASAAGA